MTTRYLSPDEFLSTFPDLQTKQILGATKADATINTAFLIQCIEKAEAEADAYIQVQYTLPLRSVPMILKQFVGDIARYRLYFQRATPEIDKLVAARKNMLGVPNQETALARNATVPRVKAVVRPRSLDGF